MCIYMYVCTMYHQYARIKLVIRIAEDKYRTWMALHRYFKAVCRYT